MLAHPRRIERCLSCFANSHASYLGQISSYLSRRLTAEDGLPSDEKSAAVRGKTEEAERPALPHGGT